MLFFIFALSVCCKVSAVDIKVFTPYKEKSEQAVERGLNYLAAVQLEDGSFPGSYGKSTGIVSLVGMSFLSKGYTALSGKYSLFLKKCIAYLLNNQHKNGLIAHKSSRNEVMYSHNISTLFLSEVSGMVDLELQKKIDSALPEALRLILAAQQVEKEWRYAGGWRYFPSSRDSDVSCSGWALMALRSAKMNGAPVPDDSINAAVNFIIRNSDPDTGTFGYMDSRTHNKSLTGAGVLCLELTGAHGERTTKLGGDYILTIFKVPMNWQYYGNYYNAQAMFQLGGKYWKSFADWFYPVYLAKQNPDGSWPKKNISEVYATAMTLLALTVPYRQLPIYQRDETVGGFK